MHDSPRESRKVALISPLVYLQPPFLWDNEGKGDVTHLFLHAKSYVKDRVGDLIFFAEYQQIIFDDKVTRYKAWKGCVTGNTFLPVGIIPQIANVARVAQTQDW